MNTPELLDGHMGRVTTNTEAQGLAYEGRSQHLQLVEFPNEAQCRKSHVQCFLVASVGR